MYMLHVFDLYCAELKKKSYKKVFLRDDKMFVAS